MRYVTRMLLPALLLAAPLGAVTAQEAPLADTATIHELRMVDGSVLYGSILSSGDPLRIRLLSGDVLEITRARVAALAVASGRVVRGQFWREDPNATRLFFGPTARGMEMGSGYLAGYFLVMPFLGWAVTDDLILAGGTPFFGGFDERPYWLAPKLRVVDRERVDVAVGALAFAVEDESAGVLYGVSTWGRPDLALSVGLGFGFVNGDLSDSPMAMGGLEVQLSRSTKLISESYLFPGGVGLLSIGPRFFGEKLSADLGLGVVFDSEGNAGTFPLINFVYVW